MTARTAEAVGKWPARWGDRPDWTAEKELMQFLTILMLAVFSAALIIFGQWASMFTLLLGFCIGYCIEKSKKEWKHEVP